MTGGRSEPTTLRSVTEPIVEPPSYIAWLSGLHPTHGSNINVKYADDSYLLIGSNSLHTATDEFVNITTWTENNSLRLNEFRTKHMLVSRKLISTRHIPIIVKGATRVESMSLQGATISSDLRMDWHISRVLSTASTSLYSLGILRSQGLF